ncbi:aldo/keto reductase [Glutamicibacter protophormiae]|uniref:aldo/keto reductase n=2 Tax=unclassified Kocuria TaxID=2649579 RepID=UPI000F878AFF|nr:aldo/keto reductase [Kocuria sp. HSID17590]RUP83950.1 aldo/keto reductase [Kocuria sp. HSID17590]WNB88085.1 aldo/keto reductase [Glutamicibacter protophormiae]
MSSPLVYGCMNLGGSWGQTEIPAAQYDVARDAVHAAHRAGITLFDHADIYVGGDSETVFGRILAEDESLRRSVRIQTKCGIKLPGNTGPAGSPAHYRLDRDSIRSSLEGSLRRLGVDRVERLFLHRPDPLTPLGETARALDELHREGLIGSVGLSNMTSHHVAALQQLMCVPLTAVQIQMSLEHRDFVESQVLANHPDGAAVSFPQGLLAQCVADEIELQAWGALAGGAYSGAPAPSSGPVASSGSATSEDGGASGADASSGTEPATSTADGDAARDATGSAGGTTATSPRERTSALVAELAARMDLSPEAVVVGWLLRHPYGIRPVVGTLNPRRIAACAQAPRAAELMNHEDWYALWTAARGRPLP